MARSAEKAATELSRWYQYKLEKEGKTMLTDETRPYLATECHDQKEAIRWRRDIIQEISTHVTSIQNAQLGEFRLRDLNDHINKLLREKGHWEERIKELGGPDYKKSAPKMLTKEGKEVPGNRGYRYFGAARDLPGVRELFENKKVEEVKKARPELMKFVDADYFGYRDEDDGIILGLEQDAEVRARREAVEKWRHDTKVVQENPDYQERFVDDSVQIIEDTNKMDDEDEDVMHKIEYSEVRTGEGLRPVVALVEVPTQLQVQQAILLRKKRELMERYAGDSLETDIETRKALGLKIKPVKATIQATEPAAHTDNQTDTVPDMETSDTQPTEQTDKPS
jgi:pre-mRNA-splicing factor ISY1